MTQLDATTVRRLAKGAIAALLRRAHPDVPLPRACAASDVRLVEECTLNGTWDAETVEQMHLDAIEGAFDRSKSRDPTPTFIWGHPRHFLANVRVGREKRLKAAAVPRSKPAHDEPAAPHAWVAEHMRRAAGDLDRIPEPAPSKVPPLSPPPLSSHPHPRSMP